MATITFPTNPTNNQTYTFNNVTYIYNTSRNKWSVVQKEELYGIASSLSLGSAEITTEGTSVVLPEGSKVGDITLGASGATQYANAASLPTSGLTAGEFAFVGNTLFMTNGSGWYSVALINQTPELTLSTSSITLGGTGNTINFTFTATDPDGPAPTVTATTTANSAQANVTLYTSNSTVTVENLSADAFSANITITASDGINQTFETVELVVQYITPIDISSWANGFSTESISTTIGFVNQDANWNGDGTRVYKSDGGSDVIYYDLSTPYDLTTAGSAQTIANFLNMGDSRGLKFNSDGTYVIIGSRSADSIYLHSVNPPYDLVNGTVTNVSSLYMASNPNGVSISPNGQQVLLPWGGNQMRRYNLSTAWDLSTAGSALNIGNILSTSDFSTRAVYDITWSKDGTSVMALGQQGWVAVVYLDTPNDIESWSSVDAYRAVNTTSSFYANLPLQSTGEFLLSTSGGSWVRVYPT